MAERIVMIKMTESQAAAAVEFLKRVQMVGDEALPYIAIRQAFEKPIDPRSLTVPKVEPEKQAGGENAEKVDNTKEDNKV